MAKVTTYNNSKLANVFSVMGYFLIVGGVYLCFHDEIGIGAGLLGVAVVFKILAALISKLKAKKEAKKNQQA